MSAPNTNIEKQKKRHMPTLIGLAIAGTLVLVIGGVVLPQDPATEAEAPAATN
jgi:hypothetical protein